MKVSKPILKRKGKPGPPKGVSNNPAGKPKGTPDKFTGCVKAEFWRVYEEMQKIETCTFSDWAQKNKDAFYTLFMRDFIPKQVAVGGEGGGSIKVIMEIVKRASD